MNNDMQKFLRGMLSQHDSSVGFFDRLSQEYRATSEAGKQELFLTVVAELATAQAAVRGLARRGGLLQEAARVSEAVESAQQDIGRGTRRTDHRFSL
jgi:hypothetical protein